MTAKGSSEFLSIGQREFGGHISGLVSISGLVEATHQLLLFLLDLCDFTCMHRLEDEGTVPKDSASCEKVPECQAGSHH